MSMRHHVQSVSVISLLLLAAALLAGCKDNEAEAIAAEAAKAAAALDRYKTPGLSHLARIQQVGELARKRPPLQADASSLPFEKTSFEKCKPPEVWTTAPYEGAFVHAEMVTEEGMRTYTSYPEEVNVVDRPFWASVGPLLTTGKYADGSTFDVVGSFEGNMTNFLATKYLGVVRTIVLRYPEVTGGAQFNGGRYRVDIYFFEIADPPKYLGGLRVDASNDDTIGFQYRKEDGENDMKAQLVRNLKSKSDESLCTRMLERAKGVAHGAP